MDLLKKLEDEFEKNLNELHCRSGSIKANQIFCSCGGGRQHMMRMGDNDRSRIRILLAEEVKQRKILAWKHEIHLVMTVRGLGNTYT